MYKIVQYKISRKAAFVSVYLFAFLFLALYGKQGFQTLNQIILWGFGPLMAFYVLEPNINRLHKTPIEYFLYLSMVGFAFLGYMNVQVESTFYRYLQVFIANFVLMITVYYAINNVREWKLAWITIVFVGVVVAVASYFISPLDETDEYFRLSGITGNANGTANYARVAILAALIVLQFATKRTNKLLIWAVIIFLAYTVLLTASRSNFANILFILGGYFAFKYFNGWRLVLLLFLIFIFGNLLLYLAEQFLSDFYIFERLTRNDSVSGAVENEARLQLYALAWNYFLEYPLLGVGLNQFRYYSDGKITHTDFLDILVQLGIFAGIVYIYIYVKLFNRITKLKKFFTDILDIRIYQLILLCFSSELFFGISNPNWFTQLEMIVLSLLIVYATKIGNKPLVIKKEL